MRRLSFVLIVVIGVIFCQSAYSQSDKFPLDHKGLGKHERPLVEFNHKLHSSKLDCTRCHHDFDKLKNNRGGEGQPCDSCHKAQGSPGVPSLQDAFHQQCIGCHKTMKTGPVMCGQCHVRK
jgi:predicted CXXCH cytochrome family protein